MQANDVSTTIVGAGRVGRELAKRFETICDRVLMVDCSPRGAADQGIILSDAADLSEDAARAIARSDYVVLALPFTVAGAAFAAIGPKLKDAALLVETLSVKAQPATWTARVPAGAEFIGINPLFNPELAWTDRPIAVVPYRPGPRSDTVLDLLRGAGASIVTLDAVHHDRLLAERQLAAHALLLSFSSLLRDENSGIALEIGPLPYHLLLAALGRMLAGDPETVVEIQTTNPFGPSVRARLMTALQGLDGDGEAALVRLQDDWTALAPRLDAISKTCERLFARPLVPVTGSH
ncbi:prephenate dehydrogenase/arogenate dehydrogenase family protein [Microvirga calopogonii]|uniref:prephenate dehydrogenase/arogenate dehydrogenase family protein n=1 Tax=Microvirga calopogonii TaxID=2078013 RepID=UPI000E0DF896|nr:prephenate dehydrogenase/arogenate dehydrogenase family protein [Microvirga calopogonii]